MEWMKFDPVKVGAEIEHLSLAAQGAYFRLMRHLWTVGPITEAEARRKCQGTFDEIADLFNAGDTGMSFDWLEVLREDANRLSSIRSKVATEAKQRLTSDKQVSAIAEQLPSNCLSISISSSEPSSKSEKKEHAHELLIWPTFDDWWTLYGKKADRAKCEAKWSRLDQPTREAIMQHTRLYVTQGRGADKQYRRDPATYLNNQNWNDEELAAPRNDNRQPSQQLPSEKYARVMQLLEGSDPGDAGGAVDETRYLDGGRSE